MMKRCAETTHKEHLDIHLELARKIFNRMRRDNPWPWVVDPEGWKETERQIANKKDHSESKSSKTHTG